ncbi:MAG: hypothetical protein Q4F30_03205 [Akkermansia sp.]|nr:hypothetical protein [Akkermansia sp.]
MKLHLPSPLRKALLAVIAAAGCVAGQAAASSTSTFVSMSVYTDFGDNAGLYSTHGVNDLLTQLRKEEGGIFIYYTEESGIPKYNILQNEDQPLISFESRMDSGPGAAVSYNILATVEHNGVLDPTFTASKIGDANAIHYYGIEYRHSGSTAGDATFADKNIFRLVPRTDFKITRLSKVVTDVATYDFNTNRASTYQGQLWYRSGSGAMYRVGEDGVNQRWGGAYAYNVGGLMTIASSSDYDHYGEIADYRGVVDTSGSVLATYPWWSKENIASQSRLQPLPFAIQAGDSGSPTWLYDPETKTYLYSGAMQSANGSTLSQARYAGEWAKETEKFFNVDINLTGNERITVREASQSVEGKYDPTNNVTSKPFEGTVLIEGKAETLKYLGVDSRVNTWNSLTPVQNDVNWYSYGKGYMNNALTYADLFYTENLVFNGKGGQTHDIVIEGNVDTGIGYVRFVNTEGGSRVTYNILAENAGSRFNTAGFVVEKDVDLHIKLTGQSGVAREWRKIGEGNLYIDGEGNNHDVLLNLGGNGTTYLQQEGGYAAYNVLANSGTRVVVKDIEQIKKDFTFGYGGAWLEMNGLSMDWNNSNTADKAGFSIHALTDEARITNTTANSTTKLTWTQGGKQEYLGSFVETETSGAVQFIYNGGNNEAKLTLHSIYTDLGKGTGAGGKKEGGIIVQSGTLALQGTVTQHAPGSLGAQFSSARLVNNDDWHYADMTTPVTVNGGIFELGNHARLTGTVTVNGGGTFVMREGVTHQMEYLEGGYVAKNTDDYKAFFGLKGDVVLNGSSSAMTIAFNENVDSTLQFSCSVRGEGKLTVDSGIHGGKVLLDGDNSGHGGEKLIQRGGVYFGELDSLGNVETNKWKLEKSGYMASEKFNGLSDGEILKYIDGASTGILALMEENRQQFDLKDHQTLIIGAAEGKTVQYGDKNTDEVLKVWDGKSWYLGGGGGELVVNYKLTGSTNLVLGDEYAKGSVYLTNTANDFTGSVVFAGGVTLKYDSDAVLGSASFLLNYRNRVAPVQGLEKIEKESRGVLLLDRMNVDTLDLTEHKTLALGASVDKEYAGTIRVADNADYLFGGSTAVLSIKQGLQAYGTSNGLKLDGQTYSGGEIRLDAQAQITGAVEVRGYDQTATQPACQPIGDITLGLGVDNAIAKVSSVTLKDGGYMDMHGTTQSIRNLVIEKGGALVDSGAGNLNLLLDKSVTWQGSAETGTINVTTNGNTLTMSGTANYGEMNIKSGSTVVLGANNALSALGQTVIENGATLNMNGRSAEGNIVVKSGGTLSATSGGTAISGNITLDGGMMSFSDGGSISATSTLISNGGTIKGHAFNINGYTVFQKDTTLDGGQREGGVSIAGTVEIANGAVVKLADYLMPILSIGPSYSISSSDFNTVTRIGDDGKIIPNTGKLRVETFDFRLTGGNQTFGGIIELANSSESNFTYMSGVTGLKTIDQLAINTSSATISGVDSRKNRIESEADWIIHKLAGNMGDLNVKLKAGHYLCIDGAGNYSKTVNMQSGTLELAHLQALENATVSLQGGSKLALNTGTVQIQGLNSGSASLYAGGVADTASTRNSTLEITGGSNYTYAGTVLAGEGCGVSVAMSGTGKQTFSGADVAVQNVTVNSGTLAFSASQAIAGNITIAQGGTLDMSGNTISLAGGQTLAITGAGETAAKLEGSLAFNGGKLLFSGATLAQAAEGSVVLNLTGASQAADLVVSFSEERSLAVRREYKLSSGDWSRIDNIRAEDMIYYSANFDCTDSSLKVTFDDRTDIQVWNGETGKNTWNGDSFGKDASKLDESSTAVFNDDASSSNVSVNSHVAVKELIFDNDESSYTVIAGANAGVQAESIRQVGEGSTTLMNGISAQDADVQSGTLSLGRGSSVDTVTVAGEGTVVLKDTTNKPSDISGDGTIQVDWGNTAEAQAVNFNSIGTLDVKSGSVDMSGQEDARMGTLHVQNGASYSTTSQEDNYAAKAIVDKGGTLETTIGSYNASGLVGDLEGEGTVVLANAGRVDLGDHSTSGGSVNATGFTGTLQLGNGTQEFRFRSTNVSGLGEGATIELEEKAQFWAGNGDTVVQADMVLHGDSGASKGSSWNNEGFGAVRAVTAFNGAVTIDGNAMVSGAGNIAFNANIKGTDGDDTLTMGCYYGGQGSQTYTLAAGMKTEGLANMVVRQSGNNGTTTVNVNSTEGLADHLEFATGVEDKGVVNVNAANEIGSLTSKAGDGVVNIALGGSLALEKGADFGGNLNMAMGVSIGTKEGAANVAHITEGVKFDMTSAAAAVVSGAGDGATRMENAAIDLAEGSRLVMENITLSTNSTVTDETAAAALAAKSLKLEAKVGENLMRPESVAARMQPLTYGLDMPQPKMAAAAADDVVSFTLQNVSGIAMEGEQLLISMVGSNGAFDSYDWVGISLAENGTFDDNLAVTLLYTDAEGAQRSVNGVYTLEDAETAALAAAEPHGMVYFHLAGAAGVPEPASPTLSLLALAALAARRRRKG